nr:lipid A deacylase LpxR family protein [Ferrimonas marina]
MTIDNDGAIGSDRDYSSGLFLQYHAGNQAVAQAPDALQRLSHWLPGHDRQQLGWSVALGQQIWTPEDIEAPLPPEGERPYAGLLFTQWGLQRSAPDRADRFDLMLGTVGPRAMAEEGQKFVHLLIGSDEPMGWDSQIEDQWIANLDYLGDRLIQRRDVGLGGEQDSALSYRVRAGNFQSELALGGVVRWGEGLASSLGSAGFVQGNLVDTRLLNNGAGQFGFIGLEGRYRFNDITIEGDRPEEVPDTEITPWQASLVLGYVYYRSRWGASLSFEGHTHAYEEARHQFDGYASVNLFWRFR